MCLRTWSSLNEKFDWLLPIEITKTFWKPDEDQISAEISLFSLGKSILPQSLRKCVVYACQN